MIGIKQNLTQTGLAAPVTQVGGSGAPAALGLNDLGNVAGFVKSASGLGLLSGGTDTGKLTSFLDTAAGVGALSAPKPTMEAAANSLSAGVSAGLLPPTTDLDKVSALLGTGQALGLTPGNIKNRVPAILDKARQNGISPSPPSGEADNAGPPPSVGPAVTHHKLRFVPYELSEILEVRMSQGINEHVHLYVKGVLQAAEENSESGQSKADDQTVQETTPQKAAALYSIDEEGNVECLFRGLILSVKQSQTTDLKCIEAEAISPSYTLDIRKNSRSFQKTTATYDDIIKTVTAGQAEINNRTGSKQTGKLIVQHKETDWGFLKRLASHFNTGLVPVATAETTQIYFGIPAGQEAKAITAAAYSVQKHLGEYQRTEANSLTHAKPKVRDADFTNYLVDSFDRLSIGDCVNFLGHDLYVKTIDTTLAQGVLKYRYMLVSAAGLVQKDLFNPHLAGTSLMAAVKTITKDQIKAHIVEIDPEWDEGNDWYFPYSTVFSSPSGSGWYAMPEPGDTVRIHFPSSKEEEAVAASSVNRDSQAPERRSDPDKKSLSNIHGKEVLFTPDGIYITNQAGRIFINLTDAAGITIISEKNIRIQATENVVIKAAKDIILLADETLKLNCGPAAIQSDNSGLIDIQGEQVKTN